MTIAKVEQLVSLYEDCARPWLGFFGLSTCIEQTRIVCEVFKRLGVQAEARGVKFFVKCDAKEVAFCSGIDPEEWEQAKRTCKAFVERPSSNGSRNFSRRHVVALLNRQVLVDSTIAQASVPEHGFILDPRVICLPLPKRVDCDFSLTAAFGLEDGSAFTVSYVGTPDRDWEDDEGWEPSHLWPLINNITDQMKERLQSTQSQHWRKL